MKMMHWDWCTEIDRLWLMHWDWCIEMGPFRLMRGKEEEGEGGRRRRMGCIQNWEPTHWRGVGKNTLSDSMINLLEFMQKRSETAISLMTHCLMEAKENAFKRHWKSLRKAFRASSKSFQKTRKTLKKPLEGFQRAFQKALEKPLAISSTSPNKAFRKFLVILREGNIPKVL